MMADRETSKKAVILNHSRIKALVILMICVVAIAGLWSIRDQAGRATAWVAMMLVGGLGLFAEMILLIPGASSLRLDSSGFTYCTLFFPIRMAWRDVAGFGVVKKDAAHAYATVGFNFVPGCTKNAAARELMKSVNGWESGLASTYGKSAQDLADLMNEWSRRARNRASSDEAIDVPDKS